MLAAYCAPGRLERCSGHNHTGAGIREVPERIDTQSRHACLLELSFRDACCDFAYVQHAEYTGLFCKSSAMTNTVPLPARPQTSEPANLPSDGPILWSFQVLSISRLC